MTTPYYPFGYKFANNGTRTVDENKAEVVRWIYQEFISGKSRYEIVNELIERGVTRPSGDGCQWYYPMVSKILTDRRYLGDERFPPLLDEETFQKAEARFTDDRTKAIAVRTPGCTDERQYPFSGFIVCGACGSTLNRITLQYNKHTRKNAWLCSKAIRGGEEKCRKRTCIYEEMLEFACREVFNRLLADPEQVRNPPKKSAQKESKSIEKLLEEAIYAFKFAIERGAAYQEVSAYEDTINRLLEQQISQSWKATMPDLAPYATQEMIRYLHQREPMDIFCEANIKALFDRIIFLEPGRLGFVLKNGKQIEQEYIPMRGQLERWRKQ